MSNLKQSKTPSIISQVPDIEQEGKIKNKRRVQDFEFEEHFLDEFMLVLKIMKPFLYNKINQTGQVATLIGRSLGLEDRQYYLAAYYANLGLFSVELTIVKDGKLEQDEMKLVRRHPALSAEFLERKGLALAAEYAYYHHELPDGTGYYHVKNYPLESAYINIADVFQGCITPKAYRPPLTIREALRVTLMPYSDFSKISVDTYKEIERILKNFYATL